MLAACSPSDPDSAALAAALLLPFGAQAEPARNFAELFHASGIDVAYGTIGDAMASGAGDLDLSIDQADAWRKAAMEAFDGGTVINQLITYFQAEHSIEDFSEAAIFFDSPLGRTMTAVENAAIHADNLQDVDAESTAILNRLMLDNATRLKLYQRMIDESGYLDAALASTLSINLAALNGMQASGLLPYEMSEGDMLALLDQQQDSIAANLEQAMYLQVAYTYDSISDADMAAYVEFLTSPPGIAFYQSMDVAAREVLITRARAFGELFAALLGESAL